MKIIIIKKKELKGIETEKIFTGDLEAEVEPVDTGFKVFTTNTGLVVTNPSNGIVSEEGTVDYTKALYIDMTADNGYYSNNDDIVGFTIYKNGAGSGCSHLVESPPCGNRQYGCKRKYSAPLCSSFRE